MTTKIIQNVKSIVSLNLAEENAFLQISASVGVPLRSSPPPASLTCGV